MSVHSVGLHVTGKDIRSCVEEAELAGMLCFQNMQNLLIRHEVLGQFLSDFVRIKSYYKSVNNAQKLGQSNPDIQHFIQIGEKTLLLVVVAQNFNPNDIQKE